MNPEYVRLRVLEDRLNQEADRLQRLAVRIESERTLLRGPMLRIRGADGPEVWEGGRADEFRARITELEARVTTGTGPSSPGVLLAESEARIGARIARLHHDAQEAGRAARLAAASGGP